MSGVSTKDKFARLRSVLKEAGVSSEALYLLDQIEQGVTYEYTPNATTLISHAMQAVEDEFGGDDPACSQLRKIFIDLRQRKAA